MPAVRCGGGLAAAPLVAELDESVAGADSVVVTGELVGRAYGGVKAGRRHARGQLAPAPLRIRSWPDRVKLFSRHAVAVLT